MSNNYSEKINKIIDALDEGAVFIANDFFDVADYETVRKALNRLVDKGKIKRIHRGIYYRPRYSDLLREYEAPAPHETALAIARKYNWNITPSEVTALNMLGLSTQVSAKWNYISDGPYYRFETNYFTIAFKHRSNREITGMSHKTALVIQGIKALGKDKMDDAAIQKIGSCLSTSEKQTLMLEAKTSAAWIYRKIRAICGEE